MSHNETTCLLCGASAELRHAEYPGYQEPYTFRIYHCPACNTAYSRPHVDTSVIYEHIYRNAVRVPGYNRYLRYARFIKKFPDPIGYLARSAETYWAVKEALAHHIKDKEQARILEIGSGLGYLTYSLVQANYQVVGLDISQTAVKQATENFGSRYVCADLYEYSGVNAGSFDAVISTEVIEHTGDPSAFIEAAVKLLKPGGLAIITTPNKSFYPGDIIWASDLPPVHYWWFSEESMKCFAGKLNLDISFVNFNRYYKRRYKVIGLKSIRAGRLPEPFLDRNGELKNQTARLKGDLKLQIQLLLAKLPLADKIAGQLTVILRKALGKLRELFENDIIVCADRGIVLCAKILKRS